jgi:hypothetical protein
LVFELIPNLDLLWEGHRVRTNSLGCRDHEFTLEKPPGTIRIAAIGDSSTFGWKVDEEDTYSEALETVLNDFSKGPHFEVMNFGVPGYNSGMEREVLLSKALRFQPDAVLLQFELNDMDLPNFVLKRENHWRLDRCYLWEFITTRRRRGTFRPDEQRSNPVGLEGLQLVKDGHGVLRFQLDQERIPPELRPLVGEENCRQAIRDFGRISKEKAIPAVFVLSPIIYECYDEKKQTAQDPAYQPYVQAAAEAGFAIADPTMPVLEFLNTHKITSRDLMVNAVDNDPHPAPPRLSLMAMQVAKVLLEGNLLPSGAVDRSRTKALLAAFVRRADSQWEALSRAGGPRLSARAIRIFPESPQQTAGSLGEGWHPVEISPSAAPIRWCSQQARIRLPRATRLVVEVGTIWPKYLGPPDHRFLLEGQPLPCRLTRTKDRAWFDVTIPDVTTSPRLATMEIEIRCKPLDRSYLPENETRTWGLLVYSIFMEPAE